MSAFTAELPMPALVQDKFGRWGEIVVPMTVVGCIGLWHTVNRDNTPVWVLVHLPSKFGLRMPTDTIHTGLTRKQDALALACYVNEVQGINTRWPSPETVQRVETLVKRWLLADGNPEERNEGA